MAKRGGTKLCKYCKTEIPAAAKVCPNCRKKQGGIAKWVIIGVVALIIIGASFGGGDNEKESENESLAVKSEETQIETEEVAKETQGIPKEYENALRKANNYSDTMHMSKQGIYDQLTSEYGEKFTEDAAQYAIDNMDVDWKANALAKAKEYQDTMAMSHDAIYDQLISEYGEKFTEEEAQYAVDNLE